MKCKKCDRSLLDRVAQLSLEEMEAALLRGNPPIKARDKARRHGPLCDDCLAQWLEDPRGGQSTISRDRISIDRPKRVRAHSS